MNEDARIKTTLDGLKAKFLGAKSIVINGGSNPVISFLGRLNYAN